MTGVRVSVSASAQRRVGAAAGALAAAAGPVLVIGATRAAADDLVRGVARTRRATFGLDRASLIQVAARLALPALAEAGLTPGSALGGEAVATRATFEAIRAGALRYLAPVAHLPGFPRALSRTLLDLALSAVETDDLLPVDPSGADLAALQAGAARCTREARVVDRAAVFHLAAAAAAERPVAQTLILLDVPVVHPAERAFARALVAQASQVLVTVPASDRETLESWEGCGAEVTHDDETEASGDLSRVRRHLFDASAAPTPREPDGAVQLFSAPGEGREAVEVVRRVLAEARAGVPFDEMAVLLRAPEGYVGLLEHALARAGVPAWFERGARRPDPSGRALLALLACADEQLSAARFAEYLSLGQVPAPETIAPAWEPPSDDVLDPRALAETASDADEAEPEREADSRTGTLQAPWRWERILADAAVIGRDPERWRRRLDGRYAELQRQQDDAARLERDEARVAALTRTMEQVDRLRRFALPVIGDMASWPARAPWGVWLDALSAFTPRVLRRPASVLRVLADLRPMSDVGPIDLAEVRRVLGDRLLSIEAPAQGRREGRLFVATPEQARGRSFRVAFVPGLAERLFPQKPREDPLLLDGARAAVHGALATQRRRLAAERLQLQLAVGAASERLYLSYPRIDLAEARARVPSFYVLDVVRAVTGRVPDHETLEESARDVGDATLAWPAPSRPDDAIDEQEHDLAVLRRLLDEPDPRRVRGHGHYFLRLNDWLRRSVTGRWMRGQPRWTRYDGIAGPTEHTRAALDAQRLGARAYSVSALQRFGTCPYQFMLGAFYRLQPFELPEPLQQMDPLTRGSLFHEMQTHTLERLRAVGALPVTPASIDAARLVLDDVIGRRAAAAHDALAPAVERVWDAEVAALTRDLHAWLEHLVRSGESWVPAHFELAFGAAGVPGPRDAASVDADAVIDGRFRLRGAVDLVEVHREREALRVTDHKTGRAPERLDRVLTRGGTILQPVLYPLALEAALGRRVEQGRLFYCTAAGGFEEHVIPANDVARAAGIEVLDVIDRAIAAGRLMAAPVREACDRCDFRPVCGPDAQRRGRLKPREPLADLEALRGRP